MTLKYKMNYRQGSGLFLIIAMITRNPKMQLALNPFPLTSVIKFCLLYFTKEHSFDTKIVSNLTMIKNTKTLTGHTALNFFLTYFLAKLRKDIG